MGHRSVKLVSCRCRTSRGWIFDNSTSHGGCPDVVCSASGVSCWTIPFSTRGGVFRDRRSDVCDIARKSFRLTSSRPARSPCFSTALRFSKRPTLLATCEGDLHEKSKAIPMRGSRTGLQHRRGNGLAVDEKCEPAMETAIWPIGSCPPTLASWQELPLGCPPRQKTPHPERKCRCETISITDGRTFAKGG
jgi:hypothetical protein